VRSPVGTPVGIIFEAEKGERGEQGMRGIQNKQNLEKVL